VRVLGIETSCDETGVAIYDSELGLIAQELYSQIDLHSEYGGVVPELASRDHLSKLLPMIDSVLAKSNQNKESLDAIAYTAGPGLIGALLVGSLLAKSLALSWKLPSIGIHHMEGHLLSPFLDDNSTMSFPTLALLVSGGHTQLVLASDLGTYQVLGETLDDAAGEAFDKVAKMLDLNYPGGPEISKLAQHGSRDRFDFPRPMVKHAGLDFSFSGLKTHTLTLIKYLKENNNYDQQAQADIAAGFEWAVAETLSLKCRRAIRQTGVKSLLVAGGVSANTTLREALQKMLDKEGGVLYQAPLEYCTDNGAMIAYAGCQRLLVGDDTQLDCALRPRWPLGELLIKNKER
jgi:N6-L-threonylcarbamoyladenine synthase